VSYLRLYPTGCHPEISVQSAGPFKDSATFSPAAVDNGQFFAENRDYLQDFGNPEPQLRVHPHNGDDISSADFVKQRLLWSVSSLLGVSHVH